MSFWNLCFGWLNGGDDASSSACGDSEINPANGLPMMGCVDIEGNPYGTDMSHDWHNDDLFNTGSLSDDSWSSGFSDDSWASSSWSHDD